MRPARRVSSHAVTIYRILMPNRLAEETSPYLRQHADNPVDWYPWGPEALARARSEDRPILLSIGYAACHWCHVMAHESFEDSATAAVMNEHFVNIKVDREERPDIDSIYMQAVQAMTGHGGWPMTMFLTPAGDPFYSGTYFPPDDRHGIPSFRKILHAVSAAYRERRGDVQQTADELRKIYEHSDAAAPGTVSAQTLDLAYRGLAQRYDARHGGFGAAPKFPPTMSLDFLLRHWARNAAGFSLEMSLETFRHMARGGIYDQVGGGFHRYAVDGIWLVPHFEKMLYDNALLTRFGAHLWQATKDEEVRRVTEETAEWVLREMTSPSGGFYSSLDADSEGEEGKFYVWQSDEIDRLMGQSASILKDHYGVSVGGNFEGSNILHVATPLKVVAARAGREQAAVDSMVRESKQKLYEARSHRVWPARDEKIIAAWNGLMLRGLATAARVFGRSDFQRAAVKNAEFLMRELVREGRVLRSHMEGVSRIPGFLEDHAAVALGFLAVYEITFDPSWVMQANALAQSIRAHFRDPISSVLYDTASDSEQLITRPRDITDNATPSGNSLAAELLMHLGVLLDDAAMRADARGIVESLGAALPQHPAAFGHLLGVADMVVHGPVEVAVSGDPESPELTSLTSVISQQYLPSLVLAGGRLEAGTPMALLRDRDEADGARAYVCRGYTCDVPTKDPVALAAQLSETARAASIR
jgi:uncharacterized protein